MKNFPEGFTIGFGIRKSLSPGASFVLTSSYQEEIRAVPTNCLLFPFKKKCKSVKCKIGAAGPSQTGWEEGQFHCLGRTQQSHNLADSFVSEAVRLSI